MYLNNSTDRHCADFCECQPAEVRRLQYVHSALVLEQDVVFALECLPMHRPKAATYPVVAVCCSIVRVMNAVIIHRRQTYDQHRATEIWPCAFFASENEICSKRVCFDWEFLVWLELFPTQVPALGEGAHSAGLRRKFANAGSKFPDEKL